VEEECVVVWVGVWRVEREVVVVFRVVVEGGEEGRREHVGPKFVAFVVGVGVGGVGVEVGVVKSSSTS